MASQSVELKCADYQVRSASMGHSRAGAVFRCTISPIGEEIWQRLDAAARTKGMVRLIFPKAPLLLEQVEVRRLDEASVRITGKIVAP